MRHLSAIELIQVFGGEIPYDLYYASVETYFGHKLEDMTISTYTPNVVVGWCGPSRYQLIKGKYQDETYFFFLEKGVVIFSEKV